ncbi:hypothetical protein [Aquibacillus rhizosphaerae]|uniref:Uncharacterized protein n=1 Tax=Aquibacillus rhizosphaerae TaxID=3051431 RepID=A0ABT7LC96_9BACI|nr:hypothetical protein [Aquibacillus sp. LR5S19]MDL4842810.1 hypothetical protein [Aquibacillus sp. LR5S19]
MTLMIMNEDLDHGIQDYTARAIIKRWNKGESLENLATKFKRDEWEIVFCLRHMAVNKKCEIRPIGFRYKEVRGEKA